LFKEGGKINKESFDWLDIIGLVIGFGFTFVVTYVLIKCYFKGSYRVILDFNAYGEAIPELTLGIIGSVFLAYTLTKAVLKKRKTLTLNY